MRQKKTIKDFNWKIGAKIVAICTVIGAGYAYASQRYVIGLDTQNHRCLDEWFFVIDTWNKPTADPGRCERLHRRNPHGRANPANAKWGPGQVMVKRAVATRPGDIIDIDDDGAHFTRGSEHWRHGTKLEAATAIGTTPEALHRQIVLGEGELFLMGDHYMSYDGRYYGQVNENQVVGSVLWSF